MPGERLKEICVDCERGTHGKCSMFCDCREIECSAKAPFWDTKATFDNTHDADCQYWQGASESIDGCTCDPTGMTRESENPDDGTNQPTLFPFVA